MQLHKVINSDLKMLCFYFGWSHSKSLRGSIGNHTLNDTRGLPLLSDSSDQPQFVSYIVGGRVKGDEYFSSRVSAKHRQGFMPSCLHLLQPLDLQAAFVFITRSGWLGAIKTRTGGREGDEVQVDM